MEFLVRIDVAALEAEARHGRELQEAGLLQWIWSVPGRPHQRVAPDATAVHEAAGSLPLWRWLDVHVEPPRPTRWSGRPSPPES